MTLLQSWVTSANHPDCSFPLNNLPCGVFSIADDEPRCGVAIGDMILDLRACERAGLVDIGGAALFDEPHWNKLMAEGYRVWNDLRGRLLELLDASSTAQGELECLLVAHSSATLHLPFEVAEYTDFYAGRHHATNVGTMFRGAENALPPNWLHMPIGYNGRASSVVVSGTDIRRPWGQLKGPNDSKPRFAPSARFDFELELGAIVGVDSDVPVGIDRADQMIFGYVLLNDWSARDIQAWEYQQLGPFQAKATATSVSPWIVTKAALEPFRCATPEREFPLLAHLRDTTPMLYDIDLAVQLAPADRSATTITRTNYREMYYSSAQQLAHHSSSGCPMRTGDLLGSGTISGAEKYQRGALLELSWGGAEPITLDSGESRSFLEDGDSVVLTGAAHGDGYTIGFGDCTGAVLSAVDDPYQP